MSRGWTNAALVTAGALAGVIVVGAARFATDTHEHTVHYHANWAVFVDGERLDLTADRYMEDVFQCTLDPMQQRPEDRVHMHENNHDVVHVHAPGVTWGHFLANLGFGAGDDYLDTDRGQFRADGGRTLKFVLNGAPTRSVRNLPIGARDRLLISFGPESPEEAIALQFTQVASDASRYDELSDPASCAGAVEEGLGERLRRAFWY
jgi:hypothetical protein